MEAGSQQHFLEVLAQRIPVNASFQKNLFCRQDLTPTHPHKILNLSNILFVDKENIFSFLHSFRLLTIFDMHDEHHNIMNI